MRKKYEYDDFDFYDKEFQLQSILAEFGILFVIFLVGVIAVCGIYYFVVYSGMFQDVSDSEWFSFMRTNVEETDELVEPKDETVFGKAIYETESEFILDLDAESVLMSPDGSYLVSYMPSEKLNVVSLMDDELDVHTSEFKNSDPVLKLKFLGGLSSYDIALLHHEKTADYFSTQSDQGVLNDIKVSELRDVVWNGHQVYMFTSEYTEPNENYICNTWHYYIALPDDMQCVQGELSVLSNLGNTTVFSEDEAFNILKNVIVRKV